VRIRNADAGGAREGTAELFVTDPDGIMVQLQDTTYCGGAGVLGNVCPVAPEHPPQGGLLSTRDLNHVSVNVSDFRRSLEFYQGLFDLPIQSRQESTVVALRIGSGPQALSLFVSATGIAGATVGTPNIAHVCLTIEHFNPDSVLKSLAERGVKSRSNVSGPVGPLTAYVRTRMEDKGGSKEGTPELYFTDPDGITLQLQDVSYCGGSGYLGNVCL
jgi:catechol 2,3-dioxygenase-like lactoylglutathione lyase family enzyme